MSDCIFCQIVVKKNPADIVLEDDQLIVFKDLYPKAPVHLLIVPKLHFKSLNEINSSHQSLLFHAFEIIPPLAKAQGLHEGYRNIINTGQAGGQEIDHFHIHLLGQPKSSRTALPGF